MRTYNPAPSFEDMLRDLRETSEQILEKALKSDRVGPSSTVPQAHDLNPWDSTQAYGDTYRSSEHEGTLGLDYNVLLSMSRVPVISAIIQTRINQVAEFCVPQGDAYSAGFVIGPRDAGTEMTDEVKERVNTLTRWLETCGDGYKYGGAESFEAFIRMVLRDSLTYDQCVFEILKNRKGEISGFIPVDASTIRRSSTDDEERKQGRRDWEESAFIQVINGKKVAEWDADSLAFGVRRPRTWIYSRGYGYPELEELVRTVTYLVNAETYNASNFTNGIHVNSILAVKSKMSPQVFRAFRRDFYAMLSGAHQAKRTPILQLDPEANEEVNSVNLGQSAEEMGYSSWMGYLTKIACAIYQIDPAELGFVFGAENVTSALSQGGPEQRILASKDRGFRPLLRQVQGWINRYIIHPIDPELSFRFVGLDVVSAEAELKQRIDMVSHYMTIDEVRAQAGLEPLEKGGDIVLNQTFITGLMSGEGEGMEGEGMEGEGMGGGDFGDMGGEGEQNLDDESGMDEEDDIEKGGRYASLSFVPPQGVRDQARRGLELRREHKRGGLSTREAGAQGIGSGVQRASDLKNGERMSPRTVRRMANFFNRHRTYKERGYHRDKSSASYISWLLWGGDAGDRWARKLVRQMDAIDDDLKKAERADTPAEPHERVRGSDRNPEGSARSASSGASIKVTQEIEDALKTKVKEHNEKADEPWKRVTLGQLKSVWRRGAGAFSVSHRPSQNRQSWAYARVNAFLRIVNGGGNPKYTQDNDLLHDDHPRMKKAQVSSGCGILQKSATRGGEIDAITELSEMMRDKYVSRLEELEVQLSQIIEEE
jgi:hypothetical protein